MPVDRLLGQDQVDGDRIVGALDEPLTARLASSTACGQAPCSCMISARWTRHWPLKMIMSGCFPDQAASAAVHSWARRHSRISWEASITEQ
jgi:hypothetical protein